MFICPSPHNAVRHVAARRELQHPAGLHGAQVPADLCADESQIHGWSESEQRAAGADRVCELLICDQCETDAEERGIHSKQCPKI